MPLPFNDSFYLPFLLQDGILICVLIDGITIGIIDKGHKFQEHALLAHAQLLAEAQAAGVATIEEYIGDASKEDFREYFMYVDVLTFLVDNAVVSE